VTSGGLLVIIFRRVVLAHLLGLGNNSFFYRIVSRLVLIGKCKQSNGSPDLVVLWLI